MQPNPPQHPSAAVDRRPRARRPWRRRLKFTKAGRWYVGLALGIGIGAINTGNNMLFLVLGLLLGGIVLSGILSETALRDLSARRVLPREASARRPALVGIVLHNGKKRAPSYAVEVRDLTASGEAGRAFFLKVDPGGEREGAYRWVPRRRGVAQFRRVEISTRFPFGLFEKSFEQELPGEMIVFPGELPLPPPEPRRGSPPGELPDTRVGAGGDFFALRDARDGDDARHIHWPTTARQGRTVVIERERERNHRVAIEVDNRVPVPEGAEKLDGGAASLLDQAAEEAAAVARRAVQDSAEFALCASGVTVPAGAGPAHERRVLRALALLAPEPDGPPPVRVARADVRRIPVHPPGGSAP